MRRPRPPLCAYLQPGGIQQIESRTYIARGVKTVTLKTGLRVTRVIVTVMVLATFLIALVAQGSAIRDYQWKVPWPPLVVAGALALVRGFFVVYPWWRIVRVWDNSLPLPRAMRLYFHSSLTRYLPGQWWYVPARVALASEEGVRPAVTLTSTAVETILVTGSAVSVAIVGMATISTLPTEARLALLGGGLALPLALAFSPRLTMRVANRLLKRRGYEPVGEALPSRELVRVLAGCYANWLLYGAVAAILLQAMDGGDTGQVLAVIGLFTASVLGGALGLFVPQGLVIREGLLVTLLHSLLGVPVPVAVAAAVSSRLFAMTAEGLWALASSRF